jgi:hypothetical protein
MPRPECCGIVLLFLLTQWKNCAILDKMCCQMQVKRFCGGHKRADERARGIPEGRKPETGPQMAQEFAGGMNNGNDDDTEDPGGSGRP